MYTQIYKERRAYLKYDDARYLLYLNEQAADYTPPTGGHLGEGEAAAPVPVPGYSYTGDQPDGGTMVAATEATYGDFVAGLIRRQYSADDEQALQTNLLVALENPAHEKAAQYTNEFNDYNAYRTTCKAQAKAVLGIE
jgi:hypothetical protein